MKIVDAQVHIWAASTPERPWPARHQPHRDVPLSAEALLLEMDAAGVARAVLVPPSWEGDRNDLALAAAKQYPDRFAVMGRLDTDASDGRKLLAQWREQPGMLGLRFTFRRAHLSAPLEEGRIDWVWEGAQAAGLPIMMSISHAQAPLIGRVAQRFPQLRLVIDHLGLSSELQDEAAFRDLGNVLALAKYPNVAAKASALPCYTSESYPYRWLHPHIRRVYDAFGPKRMFWGTDLSRLPCTYRQAVTLFTEELDWLSAQDQEWIMGRGLCEWLGWPL